MRIPVVEVLMSTHNGEKHLVDQIESILAQDRVDVRLTIRDDGSSDRTLSILRRYAEEPRVNVRVGDQLGLPGAYFRLLEESYSGADYWALADQDDVWLPRKLERAVERIQGSGGAAMYCGRVRVVDEMLKTLYPHPLPRRGASFANSLVQNIATGSTIVLNREARSILRGHWPSYAVMHDAWIYLVMAGVGSVVYDPEMYVLYRQHTGNAVGVGTGSLSRLMGRIRRQLSPDGAGAHGRQNLELLHTHGDVLDLRARRQLEDFLDSRETVRRRTLYALRGAAHRQTVGSDLVLKLLYILRRA